MIRSILAGVVGASLMLAGPQTPGLISIYADDPSFVTTGGADDYRLTVDDMPVPIARVVPGPQPVSAIVLLDVSGSAGGLSIADAARRVANAARKGDSIRIATFARKILISETRLFDDATASKAAREVSQQGGPSPLWDALHASLTAVESDSGIRAAAVFTDGMATGNDKGFSEIEEVAAASGVMVSAVGMGDNALRAASTMRAVGRNDAIRRLVEGTGGNYIELQRRTDTPVYPLAGIVDQMRKRYRLDFVPAVRDGAMHRISVTLRGRPVRAPARMRF